MVSADMDRHVFETTSLVVLVSCSITLLIHPTRLRHRQCSRTRSPLSPRMSRTPMMTRRPPPVVAVAHHLAHHARWFAASPCSSAAPPRPARPRQPSAAAHHLARCACPALLPTLRGRSTGGVATPTRRQAQGRAGPQRR